MRHCDEYIDDKSAPEPLREFLKFARAPAVQKTGRPPRLYASLRADHVGKHFTGKHGKDGQPIMENVPLVAGRRVRVVMASKMGDVGITTNLAAEHGYILRLGVEDLDLFGDAP